MKAFCPAWELSITADNKKKFYSAGLNVLLVPDSCQIYFSCISQLERKSVCKMYLLQNRCICTADLWGVEGGYKPAILMALDFPRDLLFCLQLAFL